MIRVLAAIVRRGDTYLICQRPRHKRHGGLWEFPGGKCEHGEEDQDAITRELREELGVGVENVGAQEFETHDEGSEFEIVFVPVTISGEPEALEHEAIAWLDLAGLAALDLAPSDRRFVEDRRSRGSGAGSS